MISIFRSPCGQYLATGGSDNSVFVFRVNSHVTIVTDGVMSKEVIVWQHILKAHRSDVNCVAWRPTLTKSNAAYLLSTAGDDREVNLWNIPLDPDAIQPAFISEKEADGCDAD